jgi:hypothetical protein
VISLCMPTAVCVLPGVCVRVVHELSPVEHVCGTRSGSLGAVRVRHGKGVPVAVERRRDWRRERTFWFVDFWAEKCDFVCTASSC